MKLLIVLLLSLNCSLLAQSKYRHYHYYGENIFKLFRAYPKLDLRQELHKILSHDHQYIKNRPDKILETQYCPTALRGCYRHIAATIDDPFPSNYRQIIPDEDAYDDAKKVLYQVITPIKVGNAFQFNPVYHKQPIVVKVPNNYRFGELVRRHRLNTEHVWPQSLLGGAKNKKAPKNRLRRSDLHHLFPANSQTNSYRGSFPFGEIRHNSSDRNFGNERGISTKPGRNPSRTYFMPIPNSRGRVARAMMYFSVRYNMPIDPIQEFFLRKWHREFPVTKEEVIRNNRIFKYQKVRNPFIDFPILESRISNF